jgi:hypothetical protein
MMKTVTMVIMGHDFVWGVVWRGSAERERRKGKDTEE